MDERQREELRSRLMPAEIDPALPSGLRPAAVLVILYENDGETWIPLIERPHGQGVHGGQFALPGGGAEPQDANLLQTALREAQEEVGMLSASVVVLGRLPPVLVRVSGFAVAPFVAWSDGLPALHPNAAEVARIIHMPVRFLSDERVLREIAAPQGSLHPTMYEYHLEDGRVWGATARMLVSLSQVLQARKR